MHTCEVRWKSASARPADMRLNWSSHVYSLLLAELEMHVQEACTTGDGLDTRAGRLGRAAEMIWKLSRNERVEQIGQTDGCIYLTEEKRKRLALTDWAPFLAFRVTW